MALSHGVSQLGLGNELFSRRCRLIVASPVADSYKQTSGQVVEMTDIRVVFSITKTVERTPNTAKITVYNLSERTRAGMQSKGSRIILQAGYETTLGTVFFGDSRHIDHRHVGPDWITSIEAGDGSRAFRHARIKQSRKGSVPRGKALADTVQAMGLPGGAQLAGVIAEASASGSFEHGWTAHGRAATELTRILTPLGYDWSIQDGTIQLQKPGTAVAEMVVLTPGNGLIGTPEHGDPEKPGKPPVVKFKSLLQPKLRAGGRVKLESRQHSGAYLIKHLVHSGDTDGGEWFSDIEGVAL